MRWMAQEPIGIGAIGALRSEPNESMVTNYADFEASLGLAPRFDISFAGGAMEIYKEANVFLESQGCSWKGMCCEMGKRWMGTTGVRISRPCMEDGNLNGIGHEDWCLEPW